MPINMDIIPICVHLSVVSNANFPNLLTVICVCYIPKRWRICRKKKIRNDIEFFFFFQFHFELFFLENCSQYMYLFSGITIGDFNDDVSQFILSKIFQFFSCLFSYIPTFLKLFPRLCYLFLTS